MIGTTPVSGKMQRSWMTGMQFLSVLSTARRTGSTNAVIEDPLFQPALVERSMLAFDMNFSNFPEATRTYQTGTDKQIDDPAGNDKGIPGFKLEKIPGTNLNYLEWLSGTTVMDVWNNNYGGDPANRVQYLPSLFEQLCRQAYLRTAFETGMKLAEPDKGMWLLKVKDFDAWVKMFDGEGTEKRATEGFTDAVLARGVDDPNLVHIVFDVTDMTKAKAAIASPEKKKLMMDAGVEGTPKVEFFNSAD
jgi:hypothetical protein